MYICYTNGLPVAFPPPMVVTRQSAIRELRCMNESSVAAAEEANSAWVKSQSFVEADGRWMKVAELRCRNERAASRRRGGNLCGTEANTRDAEVDVSRYGCGMAHVEETDDVHKINQEINQIQKTQDIVMLFVFNPQICKCTRINDRTGICCDVMLWMWRIEKSMF